MWGEEAIQAIIAAAIAAPFLFGLVFGIDALENLENRRDFNKALREPLRFRAYKARDTKKQLMSARLTLVKMFTASKGEYYSHEYANAIKIFAPRLAKPLEDMIGEPLSTVANKLLKLDLDLL